MQSTPDNDSYLECIRPIPRNINLGDLDSFDLGSRGLVFQGTSSPATLVICHLKPANHNFISELITLNADYHITHHCGSPVFTFYHELSGVEHRCLLRPPRIANANSMQSQPEAVAFDIYQHHLSQEMTSALQICLKSAQEKSGTREITCQQLGPQQALVQQYTSSVCIYTVYVDCLTAVQ